MRSTKQKTLVQSGYQTASNKGDQTGSVIVHRKRGRWIFDVYFLCISSLIVMKSPQHCWRVAAGGSRRPCKMSIITEGNGSAATCRFVKRMDVKSLDTTGFDREVVFGDRAAVAKETESVEAAAVVIFATAGAGPAVMSGTIAVSRSPPMIMVLPAAAPKAARIPRFVA